MVRGRKNVGLCEFPVELPAASAHAQPPASLTGKYIDSLGYPISRLWDCAGRFFGSSRTQHFNIHIHTHISVIFKDSQEMGNFP